MPTPNAIEAALRFRQALEAREAVSIERLTRLYQQAYNSILTEIEELANDINGAGPNVDREDLIQLVRRRRILRQVEDQINELVPLIRSEASLIQQDALSAGVEQSIALIEASLPELDEGLRRALTTSFTRLNTDAVEEAAGLLGSDSPLLIEVRENYGEEIARRVEEQILTGIITGQNPRVIAQLLERNILNALGTSLTDALRLVRTTQIYAYRLANHSNMLANSNLLEGWIWWAALDNRTCPSCIAKHGERFPLDKILNDHWNGRCVPIPETISYRRLGLNIPDRIRLRDDLNNRFFNERIAQFYTRGPDGLRIRTGEEWFGGLSTGEQIEILGGARYRAWVSGEVGFEQFSVLRDDPVFGEMWTAASLSGILGERAKEFYARQ